MKTTLALLVLVVVSQPLRATVMCIYTIDQPVNLGAKADPSRIPLGPVAVETNHGFHRHSPISAPRACTHGALNWEKGVELNMNLASAFGIEVKPANSLWYFGEPIVIAVKDWPVPAYSPYRKDQVVAAVIHCLMGAVASRPEAPLPIRIEAESPDDARELAKFDGDYHTAGDKESGGPTPVPGTHLTTDARGVTWVVFSEAVAPSAEALRRPPPVIIPMYMPDESDGAKWFMIPVWAGDDHFDPLQLYAQSIPLFYDAFEPRHTTGPDINYLNSSGEYWEKTLKEWRGEYHLRLGVTQRRGEEPPPNLVDSICAALFAAVLTTQPTEQKPLNVQIGVETAWAPALKIFDGAPGWNFGSGGIQGRLVWDPSSRNLSSGSIPRGMLERLGGRRLRINFSEPPLAASRKPATRAKVGGNDGDADRTRQWTESHPYGLRPTR